MIRRALAPLLAALLLTLVPPAFAQKVTCDPKKECTGEGVLFEPLPGEFVAVFDGGALDPEPIKKDDPLELEFKRDKKYEYTAEVSRSSWFPTAGIELEVRYTFEPEDDEDPPEVLDWTPIRELPLRLFTSDDKKEEAIVEYRLRLDGSVAPGEYVATVRYEVWDELEPKDPDKPDDKRKDVLEHQVTVIVPPVLAIRLVGPGSVVGVVAFDYGGAGVLDYLAAVAAGDALAPTGADFDAVEIATNNPSGYTVRLAVALLTGPGGTLGPEDVRLFGAPADGWVLSSPAPTATFEVLTRPDDFALAVDGRETGGSYQFLVRYDATANP